MNSATASIQIGETIWHHTQADRGQAIFGRDPYSPNVLTLLGYGLGITVNRGHLILNDGVGRQRRERRLTRAQRDINRIVVIGQTGHISLEAIRWCTDTGIALIQLDTLGHVGFLATTEGRDDPRLRRAQAVSTVNGTALEAARYLIGHKLQGQHDTATRHGLADDENGLLNFVDMVGTSGDLDDLATVEASGALRYFQAWADNVTITFARRDLDRIPEHWHRFRTRSSSIHPSPGARDAADPINAVLNYGYALAETECTIALRTLGLDPGLGVMHVDKKNRDSLALDLVEPIRPIVDALILDLLERRTFPASDFIESRNGGCRLHPRLASELAGLLTNIRPQVARHAEQLARILVEGAGSEVRIGTPLTRSNWTASNAHGPRAQPPVVAASRTCENCGGALASRHRILCAPCSKERRTELNAANSVTLNERLAELRARGQDPRTSAQASARRSAGNSASNRERYAWSPSTEESALTEEWFDTEIAPHLTSIMRRDIQKVLGVSDTAAGKIRSGRLRPHRRHWLLLQDLTSKHSGGDAPFPIESSREESA